MDAEKFAATFKEKHEVKTRIRDYRKEVGGYIEIAEALVEQFRDFFDSTLDPEAEPGEIGSEQYDEYYDSLRNRSIRIAAVEDRDLGKGHLVADVRPFDISKSRLDSRDYYEDASGFSVSFSFVPESGEHVGYPCGDPEIYGAVSASDARPGINLSKWKSPSDDSDADYHSTVATRVRAELDKMEANAENTLHMLQEAADDRALNPEIAIARIKNIHMAPKPADVLVPGAEG